MKKLLAIILCLGMVLCLFAGCGETAQTAETNEPAESGDKPLVGVCFPAQNQSIYVLEEEAIREKLSDCDVQVASCDDDVSKQIQQINNFALLGADMIVIAPTEIEALTDAIQDAHDAGCKILINGSAGDSSALDGYYDTCTVSDEYVIGCTVAMVAKEWTEAHMDPAGDWEVVFLTNSLNDDTVLRSKGLKCILNEYLMNADGEYVDEMGNVVDEANKVANPAYSQLVADHFKGCEREQDMAVSNFTTVSNIMTEFPKARLFLCYNSLASTEGGQYIVDTYPDELDEFAFFSAGVMGDEANYMVGSLGYEDGTKSVFRGACQFGGGDVAGELADLAWKVLYGEAGVDYAVQTPQGIGQWWSVDADWSGDGVAYLANCDVVNAVTVQDFDPIADLKAEGTTIYWDSENGYNEAAQTESAASEEPASEESVELVVEPIEPGEYVYEETTPFGFVVTWTVTLNEDGTYEIFSANPEQGDSTFTGDTWTDNGDGTFTTGPMTCEERPLPIIEWFDAATGEGLWGNLGGGQIIGYVEGGSDTASGEASGEAAATGEGYTFEFDGLGGKETMMIDLRDDGIAHMNLPGNTMILDEYEGAYTRDGDTVTITGFTNVDASSPYAIPGLWAWIDSTTGDCAITVDDASMTFTPVE